MKVPTSYLSSAQSATVIHEEEIGKACISFSLAIEFHPNTEKIPGTWISVLSCVQAQPLSPHGDFFWAIKFNSHGNFLYPPNSSVEQVALLWPLKRAQKSPLSCQWGTPALKRAWSEAPRGPLCLHFWKAIFRKRAQSDDFHLLFLLVFSLSFFLWSSSAEEECVLFRWAAIVCGSSINNFLSASQPVEPSSSEVWEGKHQLKPDTL